MENTLICCVHRPSDILYGLQVAYEKGIDTNKIQWILLRRNKVAELRAEKILKHLGFFGCTLILPYPNLYDEPISVYLLTTKTFPFFHKLLCYAAFTFSYAGWFYMLTYYFVSLRRLRKKKNYKIFLCTPNIAPFLPASVLDVNECFFVDGGASTYSRGLLECNSMNSVIKKIFEELPRHFPKSLGRLVKLIMHEKKIAFFTIYSQMNEGKSLGNVVRSIHLTDVSKMLCGKSVAVENFALIAGSYFIKIDLQLAHELVAEIESQVGAKVKIVYLPHPGEKLESLSISALKDAGAEIVESIYGIEFDCLLNCIFPKYIFSIGSTSAFILTNVSNETLAFNLASYNGPRPKGKVPKFE